LKGQKKLSIDKGFIKHAPSFYSLISGFTQIKITFKDCFKCPETHPFPFNEILEQLVYDQYWIAKRSLLNICENQTDFIFRTDAENLPQNGQNGRVSENINIRFRK